MWSAARFWGNPTSVSKKRVPAARSWIELEAQFHEISERASALVRGVGPTALLRQPKPESWSAAQCMVHLNLSADSYFPLWAQEFKRATHAQPRESAYHRLDFWGRILVWTLEPPPRFRFPTSAKFQPAIDGAAEQVLPDFLDRQRRILQTLQEARNFDVERIKVASPFDARIRYSIWSSFCITAAHERRHLWQAERALGQ